MHQKDSMELTVKQISERLAVQAESICQMLLPGGKRSKETWICGDISGGPGESLVVNLSGPHLGNWRDWADSDNSHGDLIDLWRVVKGCTAPEAISQAKDYLGISSGLYIPANKSYGAAPVRDDVKEISANGRAMHWLVTKRKLDPSIVSRFRIQGCDGKNIVFPSYDPKGTLINRSYRTIEGEKKVWQDKGCAPSLFGWQALDDAAFKDRTVLLCEGQIDCATWTQWGIHALSIPNGSGQTWIDYEWDNLAAFDQIYVSFDMDGPGQANSEKTIARLGKHRCLIVSLPHKDANDCLLNGYTDEHARDWIANAKPPVFKGLIQASDLEKRVIAELRPKPDCFTLDFLKRGSPDEGFYPRPGEVTVWTGTTGSGKSTVLDYMSISALSIGIPIFIASMESKAERIIRRKMASFYGHRNLTEQNVKDFLDEVGHNMIFADVVGYISQNDLFEMMTFAQRRYGVEHCIIDSMMRIQGLEEEFVAQGDFLNRLQAFVKTTGAHVHLVCHPRKMASDGKPGKLDVKGSSLIPNNADNIVAVCRNPEKERLRKEGTLTPHQQISMHDSEIIVEKQRETGWEGRFLLKFDPATYSFSAMEVAISPTKGNEKKPAKHW